MSSSEPISPSGRARRDLRPRYLVRLWNIAGISFVLFLVGMLITFTLCDSSNTSSNASSDTFINIAFFSALICGALGLTLSIVAVLFEVLWDQDMRREGRAILLALLRHEQGTMDIQAAFEAMRLTRPQFRSVARGLRREGIVEVRTRLDEAGKTRQVLVLAGPPRARQSDPG